VNGYITFKVFAEGFPRLVDFHVKPENVVGVLDNSTPHINRSYLVIRGAPELMSVEHSASEVLKMLAGPQPQQLLEGGQDA